MAVKFNATGRGRQPGAGPRAYQSSVEFVYLIGRQGGIQLRCTSLTLYEGLYGGYIRSKCIKVCCYFIATNLYAFWRRGWDYPNSLQSLGFMRLFRRSLRECIPECIQDFGRLSGSLPDLICLGKLKHVLPCGNREPLQLSDMNPHFASVPSVRISHLLRHLGVLASSQTPHRPAPAVAPQNHPELWSCSGLAWPSLGTCPSHQPPTPS